MVPNTDSWRDYWFIMADVLCTNQIRSTPPKYITTVQQFICRSGSTCCKPAHAAKITESIETRPHRAQLQCGSMPAGKSFRRSDGMQESTVSLERSRVITTRVMLPMTTWNVFNNRSTNRMTATTSLVTGQPDCVHPRSTTGHLQPNGHP